MPVTFWARADNGTDAIQRSVEAPEWAGIRANHSNATRQALDELMRATSPGGGRLILWHGAPGSGKTHALKALTRSWRDWCAPHFITDPDSFLGKGTSYLLRVLAAHDHDEHNEREWKLVILEDSGELLSADARERTGQALSRLLNVTDGLLGQGMNALVLVTTNEPLGKLHPAVQRPGRCWAEVEFELLSANEANEWLAGAGTDQRVSKATAIADLYAVAQGQRRGQEKVMGFGVP